MSTDRIIAGRFQIYDLDKNLLGRGGMGEVYRATDTQTGQTVAVKALNPEVLSRDPDLLQRFWREGEALRRLNHPNIVRMLAAVEENGRHYLVVEYVPGGSLGDILEAQGCLPASRVIEIALDLADALTRAHRLGIIHRDLKPANVLLAGDGTPRLADFGIARLESHSRLTQTGVLVGTVDYLSPEVCQGESPDERSDTWSFGVLLFEMLTGRLPFEGKSLTARITAILTQPVPDLGQIVPDVPDALADLVYRMLEKDPQQRIPSVRLVGVELEALLKGREVFAPARPAASRFATPTPATEAPKHNLPIQTTPFVGREADLSELRRLLDDPGVRLLSIVGAGGMGKTRLALEAGTAQLGNFVQGVYFISLAALQSAEAIVPTTAQALGFTFYEGGEPRQELLDYLREKHILLILDNFEHLLEGVALVSDILTAAPQTKMLTTSRLRLNLQEEVLFHLAGLEFPDWETPADALEYSAVKLFLQSARRVRPSFELAAGDLRYIARICRLVGGMPLGILLAAAWVEMLTPEEIAKEMQRSLDFLETDLRGVPERQRSLRAVFDYAWNKLTEREQEVFQGLSVFRGGFTRQSAQQVTGASLHDLMVLVSKSLLLRTPAGRYEIHELLRQYGAEKLAINPAEQVKARQDHCAFYTSFIHQRAARLGSNDQRTALAEIQVEIENIRSAWDWAIEHSKIEEISPYLESLAEFYRLRGWYLEGEQVLDSAARRLASVPDSSTRPEERLLLGKVLLRQGQFCDSLGLAEKSNHLHQEGLAIFRALGAQREMAYALCYLAGCGSLYGGPSAYREKQKKYCQDGLAIFKSINEKRGMALALKGLAWMSLDQASYFEARQLFQDSLDVSREIGHLEGITTSLGGLGYTHWILGEYRRAQELHQEMLALATEAGDQGSIARALGDLGIDACGLKNYEDCKRLWLESLSIYRDIGNLEGIADELGDLGEVSNLLGEYQQAAEYARESLAIYQKIKNQPRIWSRRVLGNAEFGLGNIEIAKEHLHQALNLSWTRQLFGYLLLTLVGIADILASEGKKQWAMELLALVFSHPASWQSAKDTAVPLLTRLEAQLPPEVAAAAQERGRRRDLDATVAELLEGF